MAPIDMIFWLFAAFAFALGAVVGSFLNVVIYRVPAGLSVVHPPSRCPHCESGIRWYDNIPIISWTFLLGGKCRDCGAPISAQYTVVEALTGVLTLALWYKVAHAPFSSIAAFEQTPPLTYILPFALYFIFICLLVVITFVDLEHLLIPHVFTLPGIALGLLTPLIFNFTLPPGGLAGFWPPVTPLESLIGAIAGGVTVIAIFYGYFALRGIPGIGGGDVTLMALVGAWLGWPALIFVFFAASFQGIIAAGLAMVFGGGLLRDGAAIFEEDELADDELAEEAHESDAAGAPVDDIHDTDAEAVVEAQPTEVIEEEDDAEEKATDDAEVDVEVEVEKTEASTGLEADAALEISPEPAADEEPAPPGPMAVPFGPFIALAALEHLFLGNLLPSMFSMSYLYQFGSW